MSRFRVQDEIRVALQKNFKRSATAAVVIGTDSAFEIKKTQQDEDQGMA